MDPRYQSCSDGTEYAVGTSWFNKPHVHVILSDLYSRGRAVLNEFVIKALALACTWTRTDQFLSDLAW